MAKRSLLLVGTRKGAFILLSDLKRKAWTMRGPVLKGAEVNDITIDTRTKPTLFTCVKSYWWAPNVHISGDLGKTWKESEGGVQFEAGANKKVERVWCVKPGRSDEPNVLYAGVDPGALFKSEDSGQSWKDIKGLTDHPTREKWSPGAGGMMVHSICLDARNKNRIHVGVSAAGVFYTEDGGTTWEPRNKDVPADFLAEKFPLVGQCVHHLESHPAKPDVLYQQNHCGVFKSDNGGKDWTDISKGLPSRFGFPIQIHPHQPDTVFVISEEGPEFRAAKDGEFGIYRSTNRGKTWKKLTKGLPKKNGFLHVHRQSMTADACDPAGLYFGTESGHIFFSKNNGESWSLIAEYLPPIYSLSTAVV